MTVMGNDRDSQDLSIDRVIAGEARRLRPVYAHEIERLKREGVRRRTGRRRGALAVAGLGGLFLGMVSFGWYEVAADPHAPRAVTLADGGRLDLDAGAVVRLPLAPWRHEATLVRGDAVFDIVHDEDRTFVIQAGTATLTDLGTRFLVQTVSRDGVSVAVFDGRVQVDGAAGQGMTLDAGQAAVVAGQEIHRAAMPSESELTAWRQGRLVFRDTPLAQVAATLSRYRSQPVEIGSPAITSLRVNGVFHLHDTDGSLRLLEKALPVDVRRDAERTILVARDRPSVRR